MLDHRLAGLRIDERLVGERIDERRLHVIDAQVLGLEPIARHADAAGGDRRSGGLEVLAVDLLQHVGLEPHQPLILAAPA